MIGSSLTWGVGALLAAYLISAVPFGVVLLRLVGGGDIRAHGIQWRSDGTDCKRRDKKALAAPRERSRRRRVTGQ